MLRSISFLLDTATWLIQFPATRPIRTIVPVEIVLSASFAASRSIRLSGDGRGGTAT